MAVGTSDDLDARALRAFMALCDVEPSELQQALDAHCGADGALRERVLRLLAVDAVAGAAPIEAGKGRELLVVDIAESASAVPMPELLGSYRVLSVLGAGGMGVVYEAEQAYPRRRVAIKTIHPRVRSDAMMARFQREVELMGTLLHPAIPQVYEGGEDAGVAFMVMELIRGRPLDEHAAERPRAARLELLLEVMDGVAHAHAAGVVHCDLKPKNILVTLEGQPKVLDFGLATTLAREHKSRDVAGTLAYMAPEQRDASRAIDHRVDVFALGVVAYEILSSEREPGHRLGDDLDDIVAKAMASDPADRYATVRELADDLRRHLALRPVLARRATLGYRARLALRRQRAVVRAVAIVLGAALLVGLGALGWGAWQRAGVEERARERLAPLERRIAELEAAGDRATADAAFHLYARMPDHAGTRALFDAWRARAERAAAAGRDADAIEAWAEAVTAALDRDGEGLALERLADAFAAAGEWTSLEHVIARLEALGLGEHVRGARYLTSFWHGDFDAAAALADAHPTGPLAAALAPATRIGPPLDNVLAMRWQGQDVLFARDIGHTHAQLLDPRNGLAVLKDIVQPGAPLNPIAGLDGWLFSRGAGTAELWRVGVARPVQSVPLVGAYRAVGWSATDGLPRVLLGSAGASPRRIVTVMPDARVVEAPAEVLEPASDVDDFVRADLDGDGQDEIAAALGAWQAYDLRIFHARDDGTLTLSARKTAGAIARLRLFPRPGQTPLLVAVALHRYPSVSSLGEAEPYGPRAGVYLYGYDGARLEQIAFEPLPKDLEGAGDVPSLAVADFDGDGLTDLAIAVALPDGHHALFMRQVEPGRFASIVRRHLVPLAAAQLDDDPGAELITRVDAEGHADTWALGWGEGRAPQVARETHAARVAQLIDADDPVLERVARAAQTLSELGLLGRAAENLEAAAVLAGSDQIEAEVLAEAAALDLERGAPHAAALLFERALTRATAGTAVHVSALAGAARSWLAAVEPARALPRYRALADVADGALVAEARAAVGWLAPMVEGRAPSLALTFSGPIGTPIEVVAPESVTRAIGGGVALRAYGDEDAIMRVPLTYDGGPVGLGVDLALDHIEIGAGFLVRLQRTDGAVMLGTRVYAHGGDLSVTRAVDCEVPQSDNLGIAEPRPVGSPRERLRIRADYWPPSGAGPARVSCRIWRGDGSDPVFQTSYVRTAPLAPGDFELVLSGRPFAQSDELAEAQLVLTRVDVGGLAVRADAPGPLAHAHERYVNGDIVPALTEYRARGAEAFTLMAELAIGSEDEVSERLRTLVGLWRAGDATLSHLLRIARARLVPVLQRVAPADFGVLFARAWGNALRYSDSPEARAALLDTTLERVGGASDDEAFILLSRARLLLELGELERASATVERVLAQPETAIAPLQRTHAELLAARIAHARGDRAGARAHLRHWRARLPALDFALERLQNQPDGPALKAYLE